jgi:hypothetical protein
MPLFGHRTTETTATTPDPPVEQRSSMFSRRSDPVEEQEVPSESRNGSRPFHRNSMFSRRSDPVEEQDVANESRNGSRPFHRNSMFSRRSDPVEEQDVANESRTGSRLFHRNEDSSITAARHRIGAAEAAERDADRALMQARAAVRQAREHVKILEREAAEE